MLYLNILILIIIIFILYNLFNIKETYGNLVENQKDWLKSQKQYYLKRKYTDLDINTNPNITKWYKFRDGKFVVNKGDAIRPSKVGKKVLNCKLKTDCKELGDNNDCGYCHNENDDKNGSFFAWGDKNGPKTNVCGGTWTTKQNTCQKLREYEICNKVKDCGDLYGDAADTCGFCPTTNTAVPVNKKGDKKAKYKQDHCAYPLLSSKNCKTYMNDNPCISTNFNTGPHSAECIQKLWKQSKCINKNPKNKDVNKLKNDSTMLKNFMNIGNDFQNIFKKSNNSKTLDEAILYNMQCYGHTKRIDECNSVFNVHGKPSHKCLKKQFLKAGCVKGNASKPSMGYHDLSTSDSHARGHINQISALIKPDSNIDSKENYIKHLNKIIELAQGDGFYGFDYPKKKIAAKICYGTTPPPPPAIKKGDTVLLRLNIGNKKLQGIRMNGLVLFEGIVMRIKNRNAYVMWTSITDEKTRNKLERKNYIKYINLQSKFFGWPGISPTYKYNGMTNTFKLNKLFVKESCCASFTSGCKISCESQYLNILNMYKQPFDCVIGWPANRNGTQNKWSGWSKCTADCGGGIKYKRRGIIYPAKRGGYCPRSSHNLRFKKIRCNTKKCPKYGLSDNNGKFYKNKKLWYKRINDNNNLVSKSRYLKFGRLIDMFRLCDKKSWCKGIGESNKPSYYYLLWDKKRWNGTNYKHTNGILKKA